MAEKRKAKKPTDRKRERPGEYVGFRSPPELKKLLDEAAQRTGRSLSSEAQIRLERSFERQALQGEALDLAFGSRIAGLLMLLGVVMKNASLREAHKRAVGAIPPGEEILDPDALRESLVAAELILGWAEHHAAPRKEGERSSMGYVVAAGLIAWLEESPSAKGEHSELAEIRRRLRPWLPTGTPG